MALGVSTTSGDVEVGSVGSGDVRVQSVSGDVRIGIGRGTRVWVDATSVSGTLESELGLEDHQGGSDEEDGVVSAAREDGQRRCLDRARCGGLARLARRSYGRDDVVLATADQEVREPAPTVAQSERAGHELVQAPVVDPALTCGRDDSGDPLQRLPGVELPRGIAPLRGAGLPNSDELPAAAHGVDPCGIDRHPLGEPGGAEQVGVARVAPRIHRAGA